MKKYFNISFMEVKGNTILNNNICDNIFWPS
jgi:hypothetical protein